MAESINQKPTKKAPLTGKTEKIELPTTSPTDIAQNEIDYEKLKQFFETHWKIMTVGLVGISMVQEGPIHKKIFVSCIREFSLIRADFLRFFAFFLRNFGSWGRKSVKNR